MNASPAHLTRIDDLTRRYARYSRNETGLGAVWAGLCLALLGNVVLVDDLLRYAHRPIADHATGFWRFLVARSSPAQPPWLLLTAIALPTLWLLGRAWIQRLVYERNGTVVGHETPTDATVRQVYAVLEIAAACFLVPAQWFLMAVEGFPASQVPGALLTSALLLAIPFVGRRLSSSLDRCASLLMLIGCGALAYGGAAESLLVSMLAYAVLGLGLAGSGLLSHWEFQRVKRELDQLSPVVPVREAAVLSSEQPADSQSQ